MNDLFKISSKIGKKQIVEKKPKLLIIFN